MSRVQRPSQKVFIFDPETEEAYEAPTTDFSENKRRADRSRKEKNEPESDTE